MIKLDLSYAHVEKECEQYQAEVTKYHKQLVDKTGLGNDYVGWYTWPTDYDKTEFAKVKELANRIRENADTLIVCGIGGSYLGTRAAIEMVQGIFPKRKVDIYFVGNTFSSTYILQLLEKVKDKNVYVNVISKSGTTIFTALISPKLLIKSIPSNLFFTVNSSS